MSDVPHRLEHRRPQHGRPNLCALVHPDTGNDLGCFYSTENGYRVLMPDADGKCTVSLEETFATVHAAKYTILAHHQPEGGD